MRQGLSHLLMLFFLFSGSLGYSQDYFISEVTLETNNLVEGNIIDFHKDRNGFMWMVSSNGIARFDGHQFKLFNANNSAIRNVLANKIYQLVEDAEGYIWVVGDNTLDLLHHATFEIIPFEQKFPDVTIDLKNARFVQAANHTILIEILEQNEFYQYHPKTGISSLSFLRTAEEPYLYPKGDALWVLYGKTQIWEKYDLATGRLLKAFPNTSGIGLAIINNYTRKDIFIGRTERGLSFFEGQETAIEELFGLQIDPQTPLNFHVTPVHYLPLHDIFMVRLPDDQLIALDLDNKAITPIQKDDNFIGAYFYRGVVDEKDFLWSSNRRDIQLFQLRTNPFEQYPPDESIRGLRVSKDYLFNSKMIVHLPSGEAFDYPDQALTLRAAVPNIEDEIWLGDRYSIVQLDTSTHQVINSIPIQKTIPSFWSILRDQEGTWWGGSYGSDLYSKSTLADTFHLFDQYNGFDRMRGAFHLLEDSAHVWAAARNGLYLIHKQQGVVARYNQTASQGFQIPFENIFFIYKDKSATYWITSANSGIVKLTLNDRFEIKTLQHLTVQDGLPSNTVYAIVEDDRDRLWMSTFNGIICIDPADNSVQTFGRSDGIEMLEFNRISFTKGHDGRIYFGSLKGVTGFHPDEVIRTSKPDNPISITQYSVYKKEDNKWINETVKTIANQKIILEPSDRFFKLSLSMFDYFNAQNLRYYYKIEGLLNDFQLIQGNTLEISGLPYGNYTLRVKGQAADRRFSSQELVLPLIVKRPFYLRWWFIALAIAIITIIAIQLYAWRIRRLNQQQAILESMVKDRTAQIERDKTLIEAQATRLRELDEVKSRFFANISHELRTPLTLILGPLDRVLRRNQLTNRDFTALQLMKQNGEKLLKRISELLDLSRLDANKIEVEQTPTFLYNFLRNLIASIDSAANAKDIQLLFSYHLNEELQLLLDTDKTEKIIYNFLTNALKFTAPTGTITITARRNQERLVLSVQDTGIGIPAADLEKIFDRFYQVQQSERLAGTGIGLALSKELAKVMDGKVWAESTLGQGSTFYVELPLVETFAVKAKTPIRQPAEVLAGLSPIEQEASSPPPATTHQQACILVVEDNADLRQYISVTLQEHYQVQTAEHGQAALAWLAQQNGHLPAVIISDIMMPIMDGMELLQTIKKEDRYRHIPMIMLTARQSIPIKVDALRIGVDDYLTKPFNDMELIARVHNLVYNSQNRLPIPDSATPPKRSAAEQHWLAQVEQIIIEQLSNPHFILKDIAPQINMSYNGFQRKLKKITGLTPKRYERSIKLHRAREILKSGEVETVSEVLYQLGFDNHYHFSKLYKEEYGVMPSEELK
ncbi:MAG: ATP-binding protein [Bacteroidota bacterium]